MLQGLFVSSYCCEQATCQVFALLHLKEAKVEFLSELFDFARLTNVLIVIILTATTTLLALNVNL